MTEMTEFKERVLGKAEIKAGPADELEEGEFIVYPSTFTKTPDAYGDIVLPGAFADGIRERKDAGINLPGLYGHNAYDPDYFVAGAKDESEDDHGWRVHGVFDLGDSSGKGKKVYDLVKSGRLRELSFAYVALEEKYVLDEATGRQVRQLIKVAPSEFSFVLQGANRDTSVVAIKSAADALLRDTRRTIIALGDRPKAGRVLSQKNESSLRAAMEAIGSVLDALGSDEDGKVTPEPDSTKVSAASAAEAKGGAGEASAAALRLQIGLASAEVDTL